MPIFAPNYDFAKFSALCYPRTGIATNVDHERLTLVFASLKHPSPKTAAAAVFELLSERAFMSTDTISNGLGLVSNDQFGADWSTVVATRGLIYTHKNGQYEHSSSVLQLKGNGASALNVGFFSETKYTSPTALSVFFQATRGIPEPDAWENLRCVQPSRHAEVTKLLLGDGDKILKRSLTEDLVPWEHDSGRIEFAPVSIDRSSGWCLDAISLGYTPNLDLTGLSTTFNSPILQDSFGSGFFSGALGALENLDPIDPAAFSRKLKELDEYPSFALTGDLVFPNTRNRSDAANPRIQLVRNSNEKAHEFGIMDVGIALSGAQFSSGVTSRQWDGKGLSSTSTRSSTPILYFQFTGDDSAINEARREKITDAIFTAVDLPDSRTAIQTALSARRTIGRAPPCHGNRINIQTGSLSLRFRYVEPAGISQQMELDFPESPYHPDDPLPRSG